MCIAAGRKYREHRQHTDIGPKAGPFFFLRRGNAIKLQYLGRSFRRQSIGDREWRVKYFSSVRACAMHWHETLALKSMRACVCVIVFVIAHRADQTRGTAAGVAAAAAAAVSKLCNFFKPIDAHTHIMLMVHHILYCRVQKRHPWRVAIHSQSRADWLVWIFLFSQLLSTLMSLADWMLLLRTFGNEIIFFVVVCHFDVDFLVNWIQIFFSHMKWNRAHVHRWRIKLHYSCATIFIEKLFFFSFSLAFTICTTSFRYTHTTLIEELGSLNLKKSPLTSEHLNSRMVKSFGVALWLRDTGYVYCRGTRDYHTDETLQLRVRAHVCVCEKNLQFLALAAHSSTQMPRCRS